MAFGLLVFSQNWHTVAKLRKLFIGQILWTVTRGKMGNTTVSTIHVHNARVVDLTPEMALVSWNSNTPKWLSQAGLERYKTSEPCIVKTWNGYGARMATAEERKAILAERKAKAV